MKKLFIVTILSFFLYSESITQINEGGIPFSFENSHLLKSDIVFEKMPQIDIDNLLEEDEINNQYGDIPWRFGENIEVDWNKPN